MLDYSALRHQLTRRTDDRIQMVSSPPFLVGYQQTEGPLAGSQSPPFACLRIFWYGINVLLQYWYEQPPCHWHLGPTNIDKTRELGSIRRDQHISNSNMFEAYFSTTFTAFGSCCAAVLRDWH